MKLIGTVLVSGFVAIVPLGGLASADGFYITGDYFTSVGPR
ncbi:hypothetical protein [Streptomyces sp. NPDC056480]